MFPVQRIHFDYKDISVGPGNLPVLERAVDELARRYSMEWQVGVPLLCGAADGAAVDGHVFLHVCTSVAYAWPMQYVWA